ncbi:hypothetical protein GCM10009087_51310 [Sphingomonas oligophenolica]
MERLVARGSHPLGIGVTCVEPGPFRTDWAGRFLKQTLTQISEYAGTAGVRLAGTRKASGTQIGDPVRASEAMIALTETPNPPRHLVLGALGYDAVVGQLEQRLEGIRAARDISLAADFPGA